MGIIYPTHFNNSVTLSVESLYLEVCADEYTAHAAPFFISSPIQSDTNSALNSIEVWQSEQCTFVEAESNPFVISRNEQHVQNAGHLMQATRYIKGSAQGVMGDNIIKRVTGPIYIVDQAQRVQSVVSRFRMEQVFIPKSYLGIAIEDPTVEIAIEATNPTGFLLHTCMTELFDVLRDKSNRLPQALLERFASLLKVNLGVSPQREDVRVQLRQSLFEQICIFIERNLGQPELSSRAILQAFGVSRASLYRMFEDHGGVRNYIMQRRVARAVLEIEQKATSPGRFRYASERWGFSSQPNFNRKIRSQFGTNPGKLFANDRETFGLSDGVGRMMTDFASRTAIAA